MLTSLASSHLHAGADWGACPLNVKPVKPQHHGVVQHTKGCLQDCAACRINEQNVDALMACALPYHSTLHFVRLVQAMRLDGAWSFMAPMQRSGAPMPRSLLAQRCITDAALLEAVCRAGQQAAESVTGCTVWMSFYSVLVSEVLNKLFKVHPDHPMTCHIQRPFHVQLHEAKLPSPSGISEAALYQCIAFCSRQL